MKFPESKHQFLVFTLVVRAPPPQPSVCLSRKVVTTTTPGGLGALCVPDCAGLASLLHLDAPPGKPDLLSLTTLCETGDRSPGDHLFCWGLLGGGPEGAPETL